jgi:phosphoglucomutase
MKGNREFEKWKKKSGFKKGKAKYENISKSNKQGIKRKANKSKLNEKKVKIKDLESLFYSNLALIENYINDVKILNKYTFKAANDLNKSARFKWAKTILKQQLKLLAVVMVNSDDLLKHKIS